MEIVLFLKIVSLRKTSTEKYVQCNRLVYAIKNLSRAS